jgi:DDE superfamily endonuclease
MDGLKPTIQKSATNRIQNMYFNGWQHDHYVSSVFVFAPDCMVAICCFNVPGCVHDSKIADWGDIDTKLEAKYDRDCGKCTVDSTFCKKKKINFWLSHCKKFINELLVTTRSLEQWNLICKQQQCKNLQNGECECYKAFVSSS